MDIEKHPGPVAVVLIAAASLAYCFPVLWEIQNWGYFDWDLFFFHAGANYRSVVEFGELPLWNPWYLGGFPSIGNPQAPFLDPWFLFDLVVGFVPAIKLRIAGHVFLGLAGMYWCAREFGLTRLAAGYAGGTFVFSTWLALHLHSGHLWVLGFVYLPWTVGLLWRSVTRRRWTDAAAAGVVVALLIIEGGGAHVLPLLAISVGTLAGCWTLQQRSLRPLIAFAIMISLGVGMAGFKSLPAWHLLRESPRSVDVGGGVWSNVFGTPSASDEPTGKAAAPAKAATPAPASPRSKWDMPRFAAAMLLQRDQRSNTREWPIMSWDWQEYGCYLGPLGLLLLCSWALAPGRAWPLAVVAVFCLLTAAGNFASFAPWTVMHRFPVMSSMRVPSRFIIPFAFAACLAAGFAVDAMWRWLATRRRGPWPRLGQILIGLLIAISLADSWVVGSGSLEGTFHYPVPQLRPRLPAITSVEVVEPLTTLMLSNYCAINAVDVVNSFRPGEVIRFPKAALAREQTGYRGEQYVVSGDGKTLDDGQVTLLSWSPCTARLQVESPSGGLVALNRNWHSGWMADPPYQAVSHQGLIAAKIDPGRHTIQFRYRSGIVTAGGMISLLSLSAILGLFGWEWRRTRSRGQQEPAEAKASSCGDRS